VVKNCFSASSPIAGSYSGALKRASAKDIKTNFFSRKNRQKKMTLFIT
jgi:hypothetical protein